MRVLIPALYKQSLTVNGIRIQPLDLPPFRLQYLFSLFFPHSFIYILFEDFFRFIFFFRPVLQAFPRLFVLAALDCHALTTSFPRPSTPSSIELHLMYPMKR